MPPSEIQQRSATGRFGGVGALARAFGVPSREPNDIALVYSSDFSSKPELPLARAAYDGCLNALER